MVAYLSLLLHVESIDLLKLTFLEDVSDARQDSHFGEIMKKKLLLIERRTLPCWLVGPPASLSGWKDEKHHFVR